jgi:hypothetical protein
MPRNDQVTRQWCLLRRLENSRGATLQELGIRRIQVNERTLGVRSPSNALNLLNGLNYIFDDRDLGCQNGKNEMT